MWYSRLLVVAYVLSFVGIVRSETETLPPLQNGQPPADVGQMWAGFDARREPLTTEMLQEWEEDDVVMRVVRFHIGTFKGQPARLAGVYGFPRSAAKLKRKLPGLLQIHGGGQYADYKACLANAKRGYATVSISWAGRIVARDYRVSPAEVRLFWDGATDNPNYRVTTDWGALDGYHAPGRNAGNSFPSVKAAPWTLDTVESPRNSGWYLCALAARRALTFLEQQPEVDADRLGVYGHSMGGKLTVLTASDPRVKAAAPSCGGISDCYNKSELYRNTLGDAPNLRRVNCPIVFLSPANDFHGRIGDLPDAVDMIQSKEWRVTCAPHHNHQDTAPYEVATQLWFDQHLKNKFQFPRTPTTELELKTANGTPELQINPDTSRTVKAVHVYYTQHGPLTQPESLDNAVYRHWHHASASHNGETWRARLPIASIAKPLWVYANVVYELERPVTSVGYYYGPYTASTFHVSSMLKSATPTELGESQVAVTLTPSRTIEDYGDNWEHEWFSYKTNQWGKTTHKLNSSVWRGGVGDTLAVEVRCEQANQLVIVLDDYAAEIDLPGSADWQPLRFQPHDFRNLAGEELKSWQTCRRLTIAETARIRPPRGSQLKSRVLGGAWPGPPPQFRQLKWEQAQPAAEPQGG